ncbi:MAG: TatD family hydrolase [Endomicrobium sp.]|jgi:TatD DNase family protein|nr:TatD family hydrolase [Endomicrobium sp.]
MIVDTHTHISNSKFDKDREIVIQRAFDCGVKKMIEISCGVNCWDKALEISKRDDIFVSFGIHPSDVSKVTQEDYDRLEFLIQNKKCVAIGETGLDYHYDFSLQIIDVQMESFVKHLDLAAKYYMPVIIHCRDAYADMIIFFKRYAHRHSIPIGVVHCFSGTAKQAKEFIEMGFFLGIDGPITYRKSGNLRQTVLETDINKLLVETDCPYLSVKKYKGQRNEPAYIVEIVKEIATIKSISIDDVAQITTENAFKLFNI